MTVRSWKHCPRCATQLIHHTTEDVHVACPACGFVQYDNPSACTIVVIGDEQDRVLLARRGHEPRHGFWDVPGGFINAGETAETCARREMREELGVELDDLRILGTFTSVYGDTGRDTLAIGFTATLAPGTEIALSDENLEARWFALEDLPDELAFPDSVAALELLRARRPLFHITGRTEYDPAAPDHHPPGYAAEGFVHLCTERQVAGVLERYYSGREDLLLLELDQAALDTSALKWEPGAGSDPGPFPHLYTPLPRAAVRRTITL